MKNKRFLKTSGKTMKNEYFWSNFERNDIDSFKWSKENVKTERNLEVNETKWKLENT